MAGSVVVVGGTNLDVLARSTAPITAATSNPGRTVTTPGGVGRNIADNLARLGTPVRLVSAVGDDIAGAEVLAATEAVGVDVRDVRRLAGHATGSYTAVLDPGGELAVAIADTAAVESIGPEWLDGLCDDAALLVIDGNLRAETIERALSLSHTARIPAVIDPVSVPKARRLADHVHDLELITPNRDELAALTASGSTLLSATQQLHERGVRYVWVRLGRDGSVLSGPDGVTSYSVAPGPVVDVTGAGDAMLAAYCHAVLNDTAPGDAVRYGHVAAALTIAGPHPVRPDLSDELIRRHM